MLQTTTKVNETPWRWFRQDPALAQAMQTVLLTGEGGDIIAAMRAMNPLGVIETVGIAFGDLCEEASTAYKARAPARRSVGHVATRSWASQQSP